MVVLVLVAERKAARSLWIGLDSQSHAAVSRRRAQLNGEWVPSGWKSLENRPLPSFKICLKGRRCCLISLCSVGA